MNNFLNINAIIIIYYPDLKVLSDCIKKLSLQVNNIIIIDNTPIESQFQISDISGIDFHKIQLVRLGDNFGIAYAQNIGIEIAFKNNAEYILFLDQDSIPDHDMVSKLLFRFKYESEKKLENRIAGVGPIQIDRRNGTKSNFLHENIFLQILRFFKFKKDPLIALQVNFLISSGMLLSKEVLLISRGFRSNYFIEHVDTEWCKRVSNLNYYLLGVNDAFIYHSIGEKVIRVWFFHFRNINIHSPIRNYYLIRNTILMIKDCNLTLFEHLFHIYRLLRIFLLSFLFETDKINRIKFSYLGIIHGLKRISGKLNPESGECQLIPSTSFDPLN